MKRLLLVLVSSAAVAAWGQTGMQPAAGGGSNPSHKTNVVVPGGDGQTREFQIPLTRSQAQRLAENQAADLENEYGSQQGCPVQIVDASFDRPAEMVLTAHAPDESGPTLHLSYRNFSGKDIESVVVTGWLKVKDNPYQLDSVSHPFDLTLSRQALLGRDVEATQALKLVANAIGFDRIELAQVSYADGTSFSPEERKCVYRAYGNLERAEAR